MQLRYGLAHSRHGWMSALASERGLRRLTLPQPTPDRAVESLGPEVGRAHLEQEPFEDLFRRVEGYFDGQPVPFDDVLDSNLGTGFQRRVWAVVRSISYGETRSYGWVAARIGMPQAPRAVGQAIGRNPAFLVVPCHRVIGADGGLCGYGGGGLEVKRRLLELEQGEPPR